MLHINDHCYCVASLFHTRENDLLLALSVMVRATRTTSPRWPWTRGTGRWSPQQKTLTRDFSSTCAGRWCTCKVGVRVKILLLQRLPFPQTHTAGYPTASTGPWGCPSSAASCLKVGDEYIGLGQVDSPLSWDRGVLKLQYSSGQACPDGRHNRSSVIRFKCDKDKVVRRKC